MENFPPAAPFSPTLNQRQDRLKLLEQENFNLKMRLFDGGRTPARTSSDASQREVGALTPGAADDLRRALAEAHLTCQEQALKLEEYGAVLGRAKQAIQGLQAEVQEAKGGAEEARRGAEERLAEVRETAAKEKSAAAAAKGERNEAKAEAMAEKEKVRQLAEAVAEMERRGLEMETEARQALKAAEAETARWREEAGGQRRRAQQLEDAVEVQRREQRDRASDAAYELDRLRHSLADKDAQVAGLTREVSELQRDQSAVASSAASAEKEVSGLRVRLAEVQADLETFRDRAVRAETTVSAAEARADAAEQSLTNAQADAEASQMEASRTLERGHHAAQETASHLRAEIDSLEQALRDSRQEGLRLRQSAGRDQAATARAAATGVGTARAALAGLGRAAEQEPRVVRALEARCRAVLSAALVFRERSAQPPGFDEADDEVTLGALALDPHAASRTGTAAAELTRLPSLTEAAERLGHELEVSLRQRGKALSAAAQLAAEGRPQPPRMDFTGLSPIDPGSPELGRSFHGDPLGSAGDNSVLSAVLASEATPLPPAGLAYGEIEGWLAQWAGMVGACLETALARQRRFGKDAIVQEEGAEAVEEARAEAQSHLREVGQLREQLRSLAEHSGPLEDEATHLRDELRRVSRKRDDEKLAARKAREEVKKLEGQLQAQVGRVLDGDRVAACEAEHDALLASAAEARGALAAAKAATARLQQERGHLLRAVERLERQVRYRDGHIEQLLAELSASVEPVPRAYPSHHTHTYPSPAKSNRSGPRDVGRAFEYRSPVPSACNDGPETGPAATSASAASVAAAGSAGEPEWRSFHDSPSPRVPTPRTYRSPGQTASPPSHLASALLAAYARPPPAEEAERARAVTWYLDHKARAAASPSRSPDRSPPLVSTAPHMRASRIPRPTPRAQAPYTPAADMAAEARGWIRAQHERRDRLERSGAVRLARRL